MKQFLCAVAAIALMAPSVASAQRHDDQRNSNQTQQNHKRSDQRQQRQQQNRQSRQTRTTRTVERARTQAGTPNRVTRVTRTTRPSGVERTRRVTTTREVARPVQTYRIGNRSTTFHRIRAQSFRYPRGYHYRRFSTGSILPSLFLSSLYFWNDYGALGLGAPPRGYVWVRYGPDLLLVNRYNGRIADVIYGAFY